MNAKLLLCLVLILAELLVVTDCDAAIVYPKEPEGGRQMVMQFASAFVWKHFPPFQAISTTNELTFAPPFRAYGSGNLAKGKLLTGASSGRDRWQMWQYIFMHGTNAVGAATLEVDERTGKPLKCTSLGDLFSKETELALQAAAQWPQVQKQDYEPRLLEDPGDSFSAVWLHGQSNDIIIPLPPTYNRMNAYQPYSESQIIRILAPEARRSVAMWAKLRAQEEKNHNAYVQAMMDYEKAHGGNCGPISYYGMSAPYHEIGSNAEEIILEGKSGKGGQVSYKVKITCGENRNIVQKVEVLEKLPP